VREDGEAALAWPIRHIVISAYVYTFALSPLPIGNGKHLAFAALFIPLSRRRPFLAETNSHDPAKRSFLFYTLYFITYYEF
jgi:hypothetical protein